MIRRILLVNLGLTGRTGTETHLRDHALEFCRRGHQVMVYAPHVGPLAKEIADAGVEVRSTLADFTAPPDIVHGNHHVQLMQALLHFRGAPAICMCHDATNWNSRPLTFPRVYAQLAVDRNCQERVGRDTGLPVTKIPIVPNTVDTKIFLPRLELPTNPSRLLIYGGGKARSKYVRAVRAACARHGLSVDIASEGAGKHTETPGLVLQRYDLVVAKARCALEALAVGCHVILCSERGLGPLISPDNFHELYAWNFGARLLTRPITPDAIAASIASYDPAKSAILRELVRSHCSVEQSADQFLNAYEAVIAQSDREPRASDADELFALANYFSSLENDIEQFEHKVFIAQYSKFSRGIMRHLRSRPKLRRWLKRIVYLLLS